MSNSLARRLGHYRWFSAFFRRLVPADRLIGRLTNGRVVALGLVPSLLLTTTGRRSGQPRSNPLLYVMDGDAFVVVGTNFGQRQQAAWGLNLIAEPAATVTVRSRTIPVKARLVTGPERDRLWRMLATEWPPYETYLTRLGDRDVNLFRLEPVEDPAPHR